MSQLHCHTPTLQVFDPLGQPVRSIAYYKHPDPGQIPDTPTRVTANQSLQAGRLSRSWDPRLLALAEAGAAVSPNVNNWYSLSGRPLLSESVDAGWRLTLWGAMGHPQTTWDGRETRTRQSYDELQRPVEVFERGAAGPERCLGRSTYAGQSSEAMARNQCAQPLRVDDSAGSLRYESYSLHGAPLRETRQFLQEPSEPDWSHEVLLEHRAGATTYWSYSALGETLSQTDAKGNTQSSRYDVSGQLRETRLQLAGQDEQTLVSGIVYNALGQIESETAGNGVITQSHYRPDTGQLIRLITQGPDRQPLQDLLYGYDPVGNILSVEDQAQTIHYFANQIIRPLSTYRYDTQYQLIEATGREARNIQHGPDSRSTVSDPQQLANYIQTYDYDAAGNLQTLKHVGAQCYTRQMSRARGSNRSLIELTDQPQTQEDIAQGFDTNGNLQRLQPGGQTLGWDRRNQLQHVSPVVREEGPDDSEWYVYDGGGQRVRKVSHSQAGGRELMAEVRYLPGLEIRSNSATGETLHVISAPAGRGGVRVLHWEAGQPSGIDNDQLRYSLSDHLGSGTLELDEQARLLSQEGYYPYGGTAWWAARNQTEAKYKTIRYSGKERDATGLYYYGFRYYAPWLGRWINPDPAGTLDGLNLYRMVKNNPVSFSDPSGLSPEKINSLVEKMSKLPTLLGLINQDNPVARVFADKHYGNDYTKDIVGAAMLQIRRDGATGEPDESGNIIFDKEMLLDEATDYTTALEVNEDGYINNFLGGSMRAIKLHGSTDATVVLNFGIRKTHIGILDPVKSGERPNAKSVSAAKLVSQLKDVLSLDLRGEARPIVMLSCCAGYTYMDKVRGARVFAQELAVATGSEVYVLSPYIIQVPKVLSGITSRDCSFNQISEAGDKGPVASAIKYSPNLAGAPPERISYSDFLERNKISRRSSLSMETYL